MLKWKRIEENKTSDNSDSESDDEEANILGIPRKD